MDMIERLVCMTDEEIRNEEDRIIGILFENRKKQERMEKELNFKEIEYDSEEWYEYEDILLTIHMNEEKLDTIADFYEHYDYYMDWC